MLAGRAIVFVQAPVRLNDRNEPLPDVIRIGVTHGNANAVTYTVSAHLV